MPTKRRFTRCANELVGFAFLALSLAALCLLCNRSLAGQDEEKRAPTVARITVEGNALVPAETIRSRLSISEGKPLDEKLLADELAKLKARGFLSSVTYRVGAPTDEGVEVVIVVTERVRLKEVLFVGNRKIKDSVLLEGVQSREGELAEAYLVDQDESAIVKLCRDRGFPLAEAASRVRITDAGEGVLEFHVSEGPKSWVESIQLEGNAALSDKQILSVMESETRGWPSFIWHGHFKPDVFDEDIYRIKDLYLKNGHLNREVGGYISYSPDFKRITLHVLIYEGSVFKVKDISFQGNMLFRADELLEKISLKSGDTFDPEELEQSKSIISRLYHRQGYVDVVPSAGPFMGTLWAELTFREKPGPEVDVRFFIEEKEPVFIRLIRIKGLTKSKEHVVRRHLTFAPGERVDSEKIRESKRKLLNTGYFDLTEREPVEITLVPDEGKLRDVLVSVKEGTTGAIEFGGAVGSAAGLCGEVSIVENNFDILDWPSSWADMFRGTALRGGGHKLALRARVGSERRHYSASFTNPAVWNSDYSFGVSLYSRTAVLRQYDECRTGVTASVGRLLTARGRGVIEVGAENIDMSDVDSDAARVLREDEGSYDKVSTELSYGVDTRDSPFSPSTGYTSRLALELAAGDVETVKLTAQATKHLSTAKTKWGNHVLTLKGRAAVLGDYGEEPPVFEKLCAGGLGSLRGFAYRGVSPSDPETGDLIGGKSLLTGSVEYSIPISRKVVRLISFVDAGYVEEDAEDILSGWDVLRSSAGVGLNFRLPHVSLSFYYAVPMSEEDDDETRRFSFFVGGAREFR